MGVGSLKHKCQSNLAAIELLKQIEAENRPAMAQEKLVLVSYVGWGGLPQVFDDYNEEWRKQREELESLLTPDELESARATTLNAHYTAPVVIRAMYAALQRLGFSHGRILEPALGLGHFIGLMPEEMLSRSLITAVEIDSLTHSGFEKIPVARATQEEFFKDHLRELTLAIEHKREDRDSRIVKALERAKKQLEGKLKELAAADKKDDGFTFEELGVDRLFVDEAHYFKNLFYVTKMTRIAGLPQTA